MFQCPDYSHPEASMQRKSLLPIRREREQATLEGGVTPLRRLTTDITADPAGLFTIYFFK